MNPLPNPPATPIAVAIVELTGTFLVGQRPTGVPLAGYAEFPGGKVHADETPEQAAARECLEETGLAVEVGASYPHVVFPYEHGTLALHFFACTPVDPTHAPRHPFRWVGIDELARLTFPEANADLIAYLIGHRRGASHRSAPDKQIVVAAKDSNTVE